MVEIHWWSYNLIEMARRVLKGSEHAHAGPEGW